MNTRRKPTTAVIYTRISKDLLDLGLGVDRQERLCRELAERNGLDVVDVYTDNDVSAYDRRKVRPAFERLMGDLAAGKVEALIAYNTDRMYRRGRDLDRLIDILERHPIPIMTVSSGTVDLSNGDGKMHARILASVNEASSDKASERIKAKKDELARNGLPAGGARPYGYSRSWAIDPIEAEAVRRMAAGVLDGKTLVTISAELEADGVLTRAGKPWPGCSISTLLKNPAIAGLRVHRGEVVGAAAWDPIVDRATFDAVGMVLSDPIRSRVQPYSTYLLTGLVEGPDGSPMRGARGDGAGDSKRRRVYGTKPPAKPSVTVGADALEAAIERQLLRYAADRPLALLPEGDDGTACIVELEAELAELVEMRASKTISFASWAAMTQVVEAQLADARRAAGDAVVARHRAASTPETLPDRWPTMTQVERRIAIDAAIERIVIGPATRARFTPIDERITIIWRRPAQTFA